jgi:hypothetical protein
MNGVFIVWNNGPLRARNIAFTFAASSYILSVCSNGTAMSRHRLCNREKIHYILWRIYAIQDLLSHKNLEMGTEQWKNDVLCGLRRDRCHATVL